MTSTFLSFPGFGGSGPGHWQTKWENSYPGFVRISQRDWDRPVCADWVSVLESAVQRLGPSVVIVAHSLACLAVAHWAAGGHAPIRAAFLVAVPDPSSPIFPVEARGFSVLPTHKFSFPSLVVSSSNDPYASAQFSETCATAWGSRLAQIGPAGHINAGSGYGAWPEGYALLRQFCG